LSLAAGAQQQAAPPLLDAMTAELNRAFTSLGKQGDAKQLPPYFLSYAVSDASAVIISAQYGALVNCGTNHVRVADVQVRIGESKLDNTHSAHRSSAVNSATLPLAAPWLPVPSRASTTRPALSRQAAASDASPKPMALQTFRCVAQAGDSSASACAASRVTWAPERLTVSPAVTICGDPGLATGAEFMVEILTVAGWLSA